MWWLLRTRAQLAADRPALVWQPFDADPSTWTYGELAGQAAAVAAGMRARGIRPGDTVLIHLENCPEFVVSWYACAALGAVAVTTNTRSAREELAYFAEHSDAVAAITQPRFAELLAGAAPGLRWIAVTDHDAGVPAAPGGGALSFAELPGDPDDLDRRAPDPAAPMSVQYTSGTTSRPKGVLWTHANALWGAKVNAVHEDLHPDDCHLVYLPLFHTNALAYSMLASAWVGARFVLIPKWSTSRFWDIALRHRCTWLSLMGLSMRAVTGMPAPPRHHFRLFGSAVCDLPTDAAFGVKTVGWWGMTETISHGLIGDPYVPNRRMSMGRPAPEYGIRVVDADGAPVEPEQTGALQVHGTRGLSLFAGYLNDERATAESFVEDGWFETGDLVTPHADGHITFADRAKDMLRVGAENVAASEIERVLTEVGGVAEAAVVSRPDGTLDEVPVAFLVGDPDDPQLAGRALDSCRARLADFKVPREVYLVRQLPRSTLSKVNKAQLRAVAGTDADRAAAEAEWLAAARADPSGDASGDPTP